MIDTMTANSFFMATPRNPHLGSTGIRELPLTEGSRREQILQEPIVR
jgi:hypothetical protein